MNIHNDKILGKVILLLLIIIATPVFMLSFLNGGLKALVFSGWIFLAVLFYLGFIALTIRSGTKTKSRGFIPSYIEIGLNIHSYTAVLIVLLGLLAYVSLCIWQFLDPYSSINAAEIPFSTIPIQLAPK